MTPPDRLRASRGRSGQGACRTRLASHTPDQAVCPANPSCLRAHGQYHRHSDSPFPLRFAMPTRTDDRPLFMRGLRVIGTFVRIHPLPFAVAVTGAGVYALATVASTVVLGRVTDRLLVPAFAGHFHLGTAVGAAVAVLAV